MNKSIHVSSYYLLKTDANIINKKKCFVVNYLDYRIQN